MRPLSEVPAETWSAVVGVAFDIDDTVTRDGRLELSAFRAMHELSAAGVPFAFFPLSVGVANVAEVADGLSERPRYLAAGERGEGFAEVARLVLAGK